MRAEPVAPRGIAGGFVLVPVRELLFAWRACRQSPLGMGDFRTWLACREMLARRCALYDGRSPTYGFTELARLTAVSEKRARSSVNRLAAAGHLVWSDQVIGFPDTGEPDDALADTIGGGKGDLAIPRRMIRLLAGGARPALVATVLGILLRCLSRGRGGFKSRGRAKASWIARVFGVDVRRVKQARKDLVALGWVAPEQTDQWAENMWGRVYHIDLGWDRVAAPPDGYRLPPPPADAGSRLPPPDLDPEPLREVKNQEPASGRPAGVEIKRAGEGPASQPTRPVVPVTTSRRPPVEREQESGSCRTAVVIDVAWTSPTTREPVRSVVRRPAVVADGAGGATQPEPRLDDVRVEDLRDTGRLLRLHEQAVARELVGASEADRLRFVAAAEHSRAVGTRNPPGLFVRLVRGRLWRFLTQADEDAAAGRLKRHLFGAPKGVSGSGPRPPVADRPRLSADALVVREVRAAVARAGYRGDPFPLVRARDGSWTRARWDGALSELERWRDSRPGF